MKPAEAYRVRRSTYTDTPMPADEPAGENPPDGAVIDYALPASVQGPVSLEILDAGGKVVRRFASDDRLEPTREEMEKQLIPLYWLHMPAALPATAGMHRWVWDLRYTTPIATKLRISDFGGAACNAAQAAGTAGAAGHIHGAVDSEREVAHGAADGEDGSAGDGYACGAGGYVRGGVAACGCCEWEREGGSRSAFRAGAD